MFLTGILVSTAGATQSVGIGTSTPIGRLHVADSQSVTLVVDNLRELAPNINSSIYFANNASGSGAFRYTGAIKSIGVNSVSARLGVFTGAAGSGSILQERMSVTNSGNVGIGNINPLYKLDVTGSIHASDYLYGNFLTADQGLYVGTTAEIIGNITASSNVFVTGDLTVNNGKGIMQNTTSAPIKIKNFTTGALHIIVTNLAAGSSIDVTTFNYGTTFASFPSVLLGNMTSGTGEWHQVIITPFAAGTSSCSFRVYNPGPDAATFDATWNVTIIGPPN